MDMIDALRIQEIGRYLIALGAVILITAPVIFTADRTIARLVEAGRRGVFYVKARRAR